MLVPAPTQALALALGIGVVLNGNLLAVALRDGSSSDTEVVGPDGPAATQAGTVAPRALGPKARMVEQVYRVPVEEPTAATVPAPTHSQRGVATWFHAPRGTCAHRTIAKGTVVTVTRPATGGVVTCKVADRGPYGEGRVIDLSPDSFAKLAGTEKGVIEVRLEW